MAKLIKCFKRLHYQFEKDRKDCFLHWHDWFLRKKNPGLFESNSEGSDDYYDESPSNKKNKLGKKFS